MRSPKIFVLVVLAILSAACNRDPKVQRQKYLESGNRYFENGKFKEASLMYRRSLQQDMRFGEAHYRLGMTELKLGRPVDALRSFQRAVELDPNNNEAPAKVAEIFLAAYGSDPKKPEQFLKEVEDMTKKLLDRNPKSFDGLRLRAYLNLARKDIKAAIADFQAADGVKPGDPAVAVVLAQTLMVDGRAPEGEQVALKAIETSKTYKPLYDILYAQYMKTDRRAEAEKVLVMKAENNPKDPFMLVQLAGHYWVQNQRPEAEKQLDKILANPKDFPQGHLVVGDFYFRARDLDRAVKEYRAGLTADASNKSNYQKRIVQVLTTQGRTSEAMSLVEEIVKENPKDDTALAMRGALALRGGDRNRLAAAVNDLQAVVSRSPDNPVLRFEYARALLAKGELDQARIQLVEAVKLRPDFLPPKLALAQIYVTKGDFPNALQTANQVLEYDPNNVPGKLLRSSAMIGMREYTQARQVLDGVLKQYPDLQDAQFQLGMLNFNEGKFREAESVFRRLYEKSPQDPRGLIGAIEALVSQSQYSQALQLITNELQKAPDRMDLRMALASTAYRSGNYEMAIDEYSKLAERNPKDMLVLVRLGEVYRRKGDINKAIETIQKAQSIDPNNAVASLNLAMLYDAAGQVDKSRPFYEKVLATEPDNPMALNNLAYIMAEEGNNLDQALTMVQKAKQKLPNNPEVSDTLGWIYIKKNLSDSAIGIFTDLTNKYPERATFHYHLAMAYFQKGDRPQARKYLQTALTKKPSKAEEAKIRDLMARIG
jgi:tetratricopeptide (TPR) repeat protein